MKNEVQPGQLIKNQCCPGFDWEVCVIIASVWGRCLNPDCPQVCGCGEPCYYDAMSSVEIEEIEEGEFCDTQS